MSLALSAQNVTKTYLDGSQKIAVINSISLDVPKGDFVSIQGASGSGKSTFLNLLGSLDRPDEGVIEINGVDLNTYFKKNKIHLFRQKEIGFVFQSHYLLADFTLLENVMLPLLIQKVERKKAIEQSEFLLEKIKLIDRKNHYPFQISGGESQRAAFVRAIVHRPALLLTDEPTGNLDSANTERFVEIVGDLQRQFEQTIVLVTHEKELAERANVCYRMQDGKLYRL